ncbi:MAG: HD domain-containing protein [Ardenticatenaceae bacterium]
MLFQAIELATKAHSGQLRKASGIPYIYHPLSVAKILINHGCAETLVVAAILHDTVEDTAVTHDDIRQLFGLQVASLVEAASEPDKLAKWETRKQHTIAFLEEAPMDVLLVVCADKLDNARSIKEDLARQGDELWTAFSRSKAHQRWYYQALVEVFTRRADSEPLISLVQQLAVTVQDIFGDSLSDDERHHGGHYPIYLTIS